MRKFILVGAVLALFGAGCGYGQPAPVAKPTPAPLPAVVPAAPPSAPAAKKVAPKTVTVLMKDNVFSPQVIAINPGDTVVWKNVGKNNHTVTGQNGTLVWDSGNIKPGASYSYTFSEVGKYEYRCSIHPMMTGTVVVGQVKPSTP